MNQEQVLKLFVEILESTPGVHSICKDNKTQQSVLSSGILKIEQIKNNIWNFSATIVVLKNANCKAIINSISSLLRYELKKTKQKIGKLNIFIGGLTND
ncbi:hypothetical protein [Mycoplasmopsis lipofaciens]|uniref:hypothetical protein n=1 Tax=Mycoplasmopsis lipofaciens TaxID=114884 RepID=UPI0004874CF1|nr:hypothetical protein [Mycoplasmopsis lipofaciens]